MSCNSGLGKPWEIWNHGRIFDGPDRQALAPLHGGAAHDPNQDPIWRTQTTITAQYDQARAYDAARQANHISAAKTRAIQDMIARHAAMLDARLMQAAMIPGGLSFAEDEKLPDHEGIRMGEIEAWRGWKLTAEGYLKSLVMDYLWLPSEIETGDPSGGAREGINAFRGPKPVIEEYGDHAERGFPIIIGRVYLWGEIVEHEQGYRAECARILSLDHAYPAGKAQDRALAELRERYCPEPRS